MFAKIQDQAVVTWPITSLVPLFPHTSFPTPLTPEDLPEGYVQVGVVAPPPVSATQKVTPGWPVLQAGQWVQGWEVSDLSPEEVLERNTVKASAARTRRNALLSASDWTQVLDAPIDQTAWALYRQALRDLTSQPGFPGTLDWPVAP